MLRSLTACLFFGALIACSSEGGSSSAADALVSDVTLEDTAPSDALVEDTAATDSAVLDDTMTTEDTWTEDAQLVDAQPEDVAEDMGETLPPAGIQAQFQNCSEPGGDRNIYDIQDPQCPDHVSWSLGQSPVSVILKNVVVSAVFGDTLFVQEESGGAYSGISVYSHGMPTGELVPGDRVTITGGYSEFYEVSQIYLESWEVLGSGEAPGPWTAPHPAHLAQGDVAEMLEGVLVRVVDVETTHTQPDCPHD